MSNNFIPWSHEDEFENTNYSFGYYFKLNKRAMKYEMSVSNPGISLSWTYRWSEVEEDEIGAFKKKNCFVWLMKGTFPFSFQLAKH